MEGYISISLPIFAVAQLAPSAYGAYLVASQSGMIILLATSLESGSQESWLCWNLINAACWPHKDVGIVRSYWYCYQINPSGRSVRSLRSMLSRKPTAMLLHHLHSVVSVGILSAARVFGNTRAWLWKERCNQKNSSYLGRDFWALFSHFPWKCLCRIYVLKIKGVVTLCPTLWFWGRIRVLHMPPQFPDWKVGYNSNK